MRLLYSLAWWVALPLVLARLWWRGRLEAGYRRHVAERLGFYRGIAPGGQRNLLWVHAVSVGETRAAEPLVDSLLAVYPQATVLLTHMTPTGRATGKALFGKHGARLVQCYLPYDTGWMVGRFLDHFKPRLCVLMETEVWPNLIATCVRHQVPVTLVNARLSERSLAKAQRLSGLMREAAQGFSCIAAQTEADAARLRQMGATNVHVTGSIKFDVAPPQEMLIQGAALRGQIGSRPVLLCASTREGEEALILDAMQACDLQHVLVVIVPRHPQRFDEVARLVSLRNIMLCRRSELGTAWVGPEVQVLLGDTMGEMFAYYAACDVAFIGGSLLPLGGQNLIEACALGKPVLIGQHTHNFLAISDDAVTAGAALRVADAPVMLQQARRLLQSDVERIVMGAKAKAFAEQHRGATARTIDMLKPLLAPRID
ncbi:lipid IV(A) 3-deoxy-D-manno-octulosonic acid transferase [Janthinobacterium sp. 17J80-10]|uniref:lipid IV(A) 3-deoxy-D-manno-octulosonic acid transferase n=1 Tax=Janthinobacterium sp. 17J80-10 TaxID=2497863 RepID=UPI0010056B63|nr:lipid IV(A) 3-deoxy-D-manno-octulosonic acid transferase [Janthinobacterium sp. 17J80-10]QAU33554.1 3-deoxy-D-manno-octulosonic acid transferase [Janthinobacterium sp. 17J80-10]